MSLSNFLLGHVSLRVSPALYREALRPYYKTLGMVEVFSTASSHLLRFPASPQSCGVEFVLDDAVTQPYHRDSHDLYWKVGIALDDVDAALREMGSGGRASQFEDVGYLTHIADPAGFPIELLQTTFEDNTGKRNELVAENDIVNKGKTGEALPFGSRNRASPVLGQITIRTSDIEKSLEFYTKTVGMKLICVEAVVKYGFNLYFLAFTDDNPPNTKDLNAVENREWCYQRGYTTLEIQAAVGGGKRLKAMNKEGGSVKSSTCEGIVIYKKSENAEVKELVDPDGLKVTIKDLNWESLVGPKAEEL